MNLELVIHEILQRKNFLTIPGFGSFVSQYQPARIIKSDYVKFIPPHKKIAFNPDIKIDDGVLQNFLITEYQLPETKAQQEISLFVNTTKQIILEHKELKWQGIGTFYFDSGQNILFKEDNSANFLHESFGLTDFSLHILPQEKKLEELLAKKKNESTALPKKVIKTLFIISPIILGAILIPNILHTQQYTGIISLLKNTEVEVDFSIPQKPKPYVFTKTNTEATAITKENNLQIQVEQTKEKPIEQRKFTPKNISNSSHKYFIVIGSFSTSKNANKLIQKLQLQTTGILSENNKFRVFYSSFISKDEAIKELEKIRNNTEYTSAWIYSKV